MIPLQVINYRFLFKQLEHQQYFFPTCRTMLTSEGTVNRSSHVVPDPETNRFRNLTPVECERLNGFPDDWKEGMPERMRYFCMGNTLVAGLIKRMGQKDI